MKATEETSPELTTIRPNLSLRARKGSRGAALVMTLILLALLGAASLATVILVSSDTMINGYYRNYRASFYAADSGTNAVVEALKNSIVASAVDTANPPLPVGGAAIPAQTGVWATALAYPAGMTAAYPPFQNSYYNIGAAGSWKGKFQLLGANPNGNPILGTPQFQVAPADASTCLPVTAVNCPNGVVNAKNYAWTFVYPYTITIQGQSYGNEAEKITQTGSIVYTSVSGNGAIGGPPSFAKWGAFINNFGDCQGPLVPGTMTGPFFTNGQWNFGNYTNPGYTFTGSVGQVGANVSWWNNNKCTDSSTAPKGFKQPTFQGGLQTGANPVVPPSNTYNQAQAVMDGKGDPPCTAAPCPVDPPPTQAQMSQTLKTINGTAYPSSGNPPAGVYLPWYTDSSGNKVYGSNPAAGGDGAGGGFYINGNATISLSATTASNGNPTQTYTITQGKSTTTIIVNNVAGTTTVMSGGTTLSLQGAPSQLDPTTGQPIVQKDPSGNPVNPTLVYVNGQVSGLSGTIQNNAGITVAASNDVSITGDLTYSQSPVSVPSDTLNSSTDAGVLGIFTNGNINLYPDSQGNLNVNASLAAIGGGNSGFATPGGSIDTWTIIGGRAEDQAHSVKIGAGNTYYDQRFANNFGPPWFPTAVPQPGQVPSPASQTITVTRTSWQEVGR
jgi:hypothetical protein